MSKHAIRIPPVRAGRRVRWTFEVSAAVGAENGARAKKTAKKRQPARPSGRKTRASASHRKPPVVAPEPVQTSAATPALEATVAPATASPAESVVPLVTPQVAQHPPAHVVQHPPAPVQRPTHRRTIGLAAVAFLVVTALAFPRHPSVPGTDDGTAGSPPEPQEQAADLVALSPRPPVLPAAPMLGPLVASANVTLGAGSAPSTKTPVPTPEKNRIAEFTKSAAPIAAVTPVAEIPSMEDAATKLAGSEAIAAPAPASVSNGAGGAMPVTITGCLEVSVDQAAFRLTDTEGADAPRSRGWRSGFLKKRPAPVALVEPPDPLALQTQVGRRVAATGLLTSRDLRVSALRVVGPSCN
jgi:hypothetical protein